MSNRSSEPRSPARRALGLAAGPALALAALGGLLCAGEAALRIAPERLLPKGVYGSGRFDADLGLTVVGSDIYYNKVRYVRRAPNRLGFTDADHATAKPHGTLRIGFFGDSYVESAQVPLEDAFFRLLPRDAGAPPVETLAFGVSGWGTLHASRAARYYVPRFGIDHVVYLFVENDPGDSSAVFQRQQQSPRLIAVSSDAPPGYTVRWTREPGAAAGWLPYAKAVQRRSLLAQVVLVRLELLRTAGVRTRARAEDAQMTGGGGPAQDPAALLSTWPPEDRAEAARVVEAILREWKAVEEGAGRAFTVLYVPRGEDQLAGRLADTETWHPWLVDVCRRNEIRLIDPSRPLAHHLHEGVRVYDDHWTPAGHRAIASVLAEELAVSSASRSSIPAP